MSQPSNSAVRGSPASSAAGAPPVAATGDFVVNLCASTTPMALEKPSSAELARYTFFVSRRREEGRERFRLHMGYFATREDAEQMLLLVRDLYPAAWVGETPGRKLASSPTARGSAPVTPASGERARRLAGNDAACDGAGCDRPGRRGADRCAGSKWRRSPQQRRRGSQRPRLPLRRRYPRRRSRRARPAAATAEARAAVPPASNVREVLAALEPEAESPATTSRALGDTGVTVSMPIPPGALKAAAAAAAAAPAADPVAESPPAPVAARARPTPPVRAGSPPTPPRDAVPAATPAAPLVARPAAAKTAPAAPPRCRPCAPRPPAPT